MEEFSRAVDAYWAGERPIAARAAVSTAASGADFGAMLHSALDEVGRMQAAADRAVAVAALGRGGDLHGTMIAVEKAGIAMELALQVRNKLLTAYETIMRTQI